TRVSGPIRNGAGVWGLTRSGGMAATASAHRLAGGNPRYGQVAYRGSSVRGVMGGSPADPGRAAAAAYRGAGAWPQPQGRWPGGLPRADRHFILWSWGVLVIGAP